jgi:hypothetical protein
MVHPPSCVTLGVMSQTFSFAFDPRYRPFLALAGITPARSHLTVDDDELRVRFGLFSLVTPRSNVASAQVTGPHKAARAIGVRTSLTDRGLTFGSSTQRTTCILFHEPIRISPVDIGHHPGLSVSVDRCDDLATLLNR